MGVSHVICLPVTVREAIFRYFEMGNIPSDGGYNDRLFVVKLIGIPFVHYNSVSRVEAVRIHDIHHAVTGFRTTIKGEAQIGAWEVASGCGRFYVAWILNFVAISIGIFFWPKDVWNAFLLGRHTRNFYKTGISPGIYEADLQDVRKQLGLDSSPRQVSLSDQIVSSFWILVSLFVHLILVPLYALIPLQLIVYRLFFDRQGRLKSYRFLKRRLDSPLRSLKGKSL